jgi:hypothetical protein
LAAQIVEGQDCLLEFRLGMSSILEPSRDDYLLPGAFSLCNMAQVAEDQMSKSDPGTHCTPQGEMLREPSAIQKQARSLGRY